MENTSDQQSTPAATSGWAVGATSLIVGLLLWFLGTGIQKSRGMGDTDYLYSNFGFGIMATCILAMGISAVRVGRPRSVGTAACFVNGAFVLRSVLILAGIQ